MEEPVGLIHARVGVRAGTAAGGPSARGATGIVPIYPPKTLPSGFWAT